MARTQYVTFVTNDQGVGVTGATVKVTGRHPATPVNVYQFSTGTSTLATPIFTQSGFSSFWADDCVSYNVTVTGTGFQDYTQYWESISAETVNYIKSFLSTPLPILVNPAFTSTPTGQSYVQLVNNLNAFYVQGYLGVATPPTPAARLSFPSSTSTSGGLVFGDTNLYRSATTTLRTDNAFIVGTTLTINGALSANANLSTYGNELISGALGVGTATPQANSLDVVGFSFQRNTTFETAPVGKPALSITGIALATPGVRFPDGSIITSAIGLGSSTGIAGSAQQLGDYYWATPAGNSSLLTNVNGPTGVQIASYLGVATPPNPSVAPIVTALGPVPLKYTTPITVRPSTPVTITHNLGTRFAAVEVMGLDYFNLVSPTIQMQGLNTTSLTFLTATPTTAYQVTVIG